ncbi:dihydrolipoamide acetyltransferase component of pyruvate dehydrogenase complex [Fulvitalea axinellae]|uniref:Acetyltransferase component of pyruvate dehydrogenase complex n=1 Tax=Fulvitalea axinellae TaxID=1182444 RepID=A0AAU9CS05_9BACT|nr:dihydrolipoamide acetyltransferase component of pyruvate dehydrogenase complex [Fulvitalea axinellae]
MAEIIRMPKMSDTMTEGVIAAWLKKEGEEVQSGDILAEVETDKATMELESYSDGILLHIGVPEKNSVPVDGIIAIIGEEGEDISAELKEIDREKSGVSQEESPETPAGAETETAATEEIDTSDVNATVIRMPKMSDTMTTGTIAAWHKQVGDSVSSGDILAEVETDKATMELESYEDGTLLYIGVESGNSVDVDGIIAIIGEEGADYEKLLKAENGKPAKTEAPAKAEATPSTPAPAATPSPTTTATASNNPKGDNSRIFASPLAKKIAKEKGFNISEIPGSGEHGRVIKRDVEAFVPTMATTPVAPEAPTSVSTATPPTPAIELPAVVGEVSFEDKPVSQMRKTIAKRLSDSKQTSPHFYVSMEINMDKAIEARKSMNESSPVKISFNDIVIKATAAAIRQHPDVNSSWLGDTIRYNQHINIGVAMAVPDGLLVPVVRFADNKTLSHISAEVKTFSSKAKNKQLQPADWEGNTFTISNLGMFGVEDFTAIINPPDACILAVGGINQKPVVKDGQIVPGNIMKVTLSSDHRVVDGAVAAAFLNTLKNFLEDPIKLLI